MASEVFSLRLSDEQRFLLGLVAKRHRRTPSDILRILMLDEAARLRVKPKAGVPTPPRN